MPHPMLSAPCATVESMAIAAAVGEDLRDSIGKTDLGLAAPQIGHPMRIILARTKRRGELLMVNPRVTNVSPATKRGLERCLSVPGTRIIRRASRISVAWDSPSGESTGTFYDMDAAMIQHELDHLEGITIDRKE